MSVDYRQGSQQVHAVRGVSLELNEGESLGLVGESGCGKSTLALALLQLLPEGSSQILSGRVFFDGQDLSTLGAHGLRRIRGAQVGFVFQDPFSALNPVLTVGEQIEEVFWAHHKSWHPRQALELLSKVRLDAPQRIFRSYPHQLSGGQRQRVCIAMAIALYPRLLIADEPTTALDVTTQKDILNLLDHLKKDLHMAILLITHNVGLMAERTDRLAVMQGGEIVEVGPTPHVLQSPSHPYTQGLLCSLPRLPKYASSSR
jgi:peptide/nickel transport system ATP-binding protein